MTLHEYMATPETVLPQELVFGVLRVADAPFVSHQRIVFALATALQAHIDENTEGEVLIAPIDVILDEERALVLQPDLLFVSRERAGIVRERVYGAPDLVVEILSPHPRIGKLEERVNWFAHYGVREIWLCHQGARRLDVLSCQDGRVVSSESFGTHQPVRSDVLPLLHRTMGSIVKIW
jgi:Uma2 family endonuclease